MDKNTFEQRLIQASEKAISWARQHVVNSLPDEHLYLVFPNQSYDGNPLQEDEQIFPNEALPQFKFLGPLNATEALKFLWRDGKVPEWINVSVQACDEQFSYLGLRCCGRFTATDELLYHRAEGHQPLHVLSPNIPPGWESVEQNGKFDLYWSGRNPLAGAS